MEWWQFILIGVLIILSGLFSGLTLGLMGLDKVILSVFVEQPDQDEETRKQVDYAKRIVPIRKDGNLLLCTLLIGNVAVNAGLSILLAELTSGVMGFVLSTVLIVIFGEIGPQAIWSRHGLMIGANVIWLMYVFVVLCYILAKPIALVLDKILGAEIGTVLTPNQMKSLFNIYEQEANLEVGSQKLLAANIDFPDKEVQDIMTPLKEVYMLDMESRFDQSLMQEIYEKGYSRIPIYEKNRENITGLLVTKDLMFLDAARVRKLWQLKSLFMRQVTHVNADDKLHEVLTEFKKGHGHMAIVRCKETQDDSKEDTKISTKTKNWSPVIGIVTLEDIIECLIHEEIEDEADVDRHMSVKDIHSKKANFLFVKENSKYALTSLEIETIHTFLSERCDSFFPHYITSDNLTDLINCSKVLSLEGNEDSVFNQTEEDIEQDNIKVRDRVDSDQYADQYDFAAADELEWEPEKVSKYLYWKGEISQNFYLILHGKVELTMGRDKLFSEYGSYNVLGSMALREAFYAPDFTAKVVGKCKLLKIKRKDYMRLSRFRD